MSSRPCVSFFLSRRLLICLVPRFVSHLVFASRSLVSYCVSYRIVSSHPIVPSCVSCLICPASWDARGVVLCRVLRFCSDCLVGAGGGASCVCLVAGRGAWPHPSPLSSTRPSRPSSRPPSRSPMSCGLGGVACLTVSSFSSVSSGVAFRARPHPRRARLVLPFCFLSGVSCLRSSRLGCLRRRAWACRSVRLFVPPYRLAGRRSRLVMASRSSVSWGGAVRFWLLVLSWRERMGGGSRLTVLWPVLACLRCRRGMWRCRAHHRFIGVSACSLSSYGYGAWGRAGVPGLARCRLLPAIPLSSRIGSPDERRRDGRRDGGLLGYRGVVRRGSSIDVYNEYDVCDVYKRYKNTRI